MSGKIHTAMNGIRNYRDNYEGIFMPKKKKRKVVVIKKRKKKK
jgi:hypothetical protein